MPIFELPAELAAMFSEFRDALEERADPLDQTPQGQDILAAVEVAKKAIGRQLLVFSNAIGARRYNARIFTFAHERRGKKSNWVLSDVQPAHSQFIAEGSDNLRALMAATMGPIADRAISIWVHPLSVGKEQRYFAFILHKDGAEAAVAIEGSSWTPMNLGKSSMEMTLGMLISRSGRYEGRWSAMVRAEKRVMRDDLREGMENFLTSLGARGLTDENWDELLTLIFDRRSHLVLLKEVARSCGADTMGESQRLLEAMVSLVDTALENHQEKTASMEKAHTRALTRFQTDVLKFKAGRDIATNRLKVVEKELLELKKRLKDAGAGDAGSMNESSIGAALDRFFV